MHEVTEITNKYFPLAEASSSIYFAMIGLNTLHYLYEFSLDFYMESIFSLLRNNQDLQKVNLFSSYSLVGSFNRPG